MFSTTCSHGILRVNAVFQDTLYSVNDESLQNIGNECVLPLAAGDVFVTLFNVNAQIEELSSPLHA